MRDLGKEIIARRVREREIRADERRKVAEEIARAIEAYKPEAHPVMCPPSIAYAAAMETAARIARQRGGGTDG